MKLDRKYLDAEKIKLVKTFIASGDSMNHWCGEMNLPHSTFHGWVKKYNIKQSNDFIEIKVPPIPKRKLNKDIVSAPKGSSTLVIEHGNFKIGVEAGVDTNFLRTILKVVATLDV